MVERTLRVGDSVRTPDGAVGRIVRPTPQFGFYKDMQYRSFDLDTTAEVAVYYVLLESGELRCYRFEVLSLV